MSLEDLTAISPPCADTIARAMNKPRPMLCPCALVATPTGEGLKDRRHHVRRNGRTAVMDSESHRVAFLLGRQGDRRAVAVLDRVTDEIRYDLRKPVSVPVSDEVPARLSRSTASGCAAPLSSIASSQNSEGRLAAA